MACVMSCRPNENMETQQEMNQRKGSLYGNLNQNNCCMGENRQSKTINRYLLPSI
jgi:hypothetical protein